MRDLSEISGMPRLWAATLGSPEVLVAVLDGRADRSHSSLSEANLELINTNTAADDGCERPSDHGTHIVSIIFGSHGSQVEGVAPGCKGFLAPIFGSGEAASCSQVDLARAIEAAVEHGAQVINLSGGEIAPPGGVHPLLARAVKTCASRGVLLVAAAGNHGCECVQVPGALPAVLPVGAMDADGRALALSNWGAAYRTQGILAPGEDIPGAAPGGGVVRGSGTSYAAAIVSGVAALLLSLQLKVGAALDPLAVRDAMLRSALGCADPPEPDCDRLLAGRLNISGAMSLVLEGANQMPNVELLEPATNETPEHEVDESPCVETAEEPAAAGSAVRPSDATARGEVRPAEAEAGCSCGGGSAAGAPSLVYALGSLGVDYGAEARRDSIAQHMGASAADPAKLLDYLDSNPWEAESILWTLNLDATPLYAVQPSGAFAGEGYKRLRDFLREQLAEGVERVAVGGVVAGKATLQSGQAVPVVRPELRCLNNWTTNALAQAASKGGKASAAESDLAGFLERIYHELRNLGIAPEHRALNYAATNAFNAATVFREALKAKLALDGISVERSPICRPGSDCWDIKLRFFDPENVLRAKRIFRYTVDVSDVCPVAVGDVRSWSAR